MSSSTPATFNRTATMIADLSGRNLFVGVQPVEEPGKQIAVRMSEGEMSVSVYLTREQLEYLHFVIGYALQDGTQTRGNLLGKSAISDKSMKLFNKNPE